MSRWQDRSSDGIARWANLSLDERLADRLSDVALAAEEMLDALRVTPSRPPHTAEWASALTRICAEATALMANLPTPGPAPPRDPVLVEVLQRIRQRLGQIADQSSVRVDDEAVRRTIERLAAPHVLLMYAEIARLDRLSGFCSASFDDHARSDSGGRDT